MAYSGRTSSSQKHLQARRCVNERTHSALSEMWPRFCNASWNGDREYTQKSVHILGRKIPEVSVGQGPETWIQVNQMLRNYNLELYWYAVRRANLAWALLQKLDFYDQSWFIWDLCVHTEIHQFFGTDRNFLNDPQRLVWSKL